MIAFLFKVGKYAIFSGVGLGVTIGGASYAKFRYDSGKTKAFTVKIEAQQLKTKANVYKALACLREQEQKPREKRTLCEF